MPFNIEDHASSPDPNSFTHALSQAYSEFTESSSKRIWRRNDLKKLWDNFLKIEDNDPKKHEFCVILVNITVELKESKRSGVFSKGTDMFIGEVFAKLQEQFEEVFVKDVNAGNIKVSKTSWLSNLKIISKVFQDDPMLVFALHGLGSLNANTQEIDKALQYYKMVIDCVNGIILSGDKSIISSSMGDIYGEYVILHDLHKLDLKKARKDVNPFFTSINKRLPKDNDELVYIFNCKLSVMWIFKDYEECLSALRKTIKLVRKNNKEFEEAERDGEVETTLFELQLLYQIAKGTYIYFSFDYSSFFSFSTTFSFQVHEKLGNSELAFQVYSKIINCDGPNSNLEYVAGSYFAMAKIQHGRNEYVNSRELFVKFFICMKKLYDQKILRPAEYYSARKKKCH